MRLFKKQLVVLSLNVLVFLVLASTISNYTTSYFEGEAVDTNYILVTFSNTASNTSYGAMNTSTPGSGTAAISNQTIEKDHESINLVTDFITNFSINNNFSFPGNTSGGPGSLNNSLKFGNSSNTGSITFSLIYYVSKVEISWYGWAANKSQLTVGGTLSSIPAVITLTTEIIEFTSTKSLTIGSSFPSSGDRRAIISSIKIYHSCLV